MTQNLRQLARGELAGSARAVAEAGESGDVHAGRLVHASDRLTHLPGLDRCEARATNAEGGLRRRRLCPQLNDGCR